MTKQPNADLIDRWRDAGLRQVTLPSLTRMKIRIPAADMLVRSGAMPQDLRDVAIKFATSGISLEELDPEQIDQFLQLKNVLIASAVRELYTGDADFTDRIPNDDPAWMPISIRAEDLDGSEIDGDDLGALAAIVMRQRTPNQVTAAVWQDEGKLDRRTAEDFDAAERARGETVTPFPRVPSDERGADAGADGEDVELPAESDGRDPRSSRRARV